MFLTERLNDKPLALERGRNPSFLQSKPKRILRGSEAQEPQISAQDDIRSRLNQDPSTLPQFPRSSKYHLGWVVENHMGANVLWLTEALCQEMNIRPGMKVLDLGCGKAVGSIFLSKEFDVQVWAVDSEIDDIENSKRIADASLQDRVVPVKASAEALPFEKGFFDVVISVNAFQYFGTNPYFLENLLPVLKLNGQLGMIVPGFQREVVDWPSYLDYSGYSTFYSAAWWRSAWGSGQVTVTVADTVPAGSKDFLEWLEICKRYGAYDDCKPGEGKADKLMEDLRIDDGNNLGFVRLVAHKTSERRLSPRSISPQNSERKKITRFSKLTQAVSADDLLQTNLKMFKDRISTAPESQTE